MEETKKATLIGLIANIFLFIIKGFAGIVTGSMAITSDAVNSLMDIVSSIGTHIAVKLSKKQADKNHPFGFKRAEPIAALMIAILASVLSFEIFKNALTEIITGDKRIIIVSTLPVVIMFVAIFAKIIMSRYFFNLGKKHDSPALIASSTDFQNDILCSTVALLGLLGTALHLKYFDHGAAIIVACFIFYSGYRIGMENLDYLMGKSPDDSTLFEIKRRALGTEGVISVHDVKAHYVGNFIHVELHIDVDKNISTEKSHTIGKHVSKSVEEIYHIDKAFVHIDPV